MSNVNIELAQQAQQDLREAHRRYHKALQEALPVGTPIQYSLGDRKYDGVIAEPENGTGFVKVRSNKTKKSYWLALYHIKGLA